MSRFFWYAKNLLISFIFSSIQTKMLYILQNNKDEKDKIRIMVFQKQWGNLKMKMLYLITLANQFLTDRDWWQFNNPKNNAMNIMIETGELAEHFIAHDQSVSVRDQIAQEMSDVLFASFTFALLTKIDIAHAIGSITGSSVCKDGDVSYAQLQELVLQHADTFNLSNLATGQQVVLSLTSQTGELADIFVWCTAEQSVERAHNKHSFISARIAHIVAHCIYLSSLVEVDLPTAYIAKMQRNGAKYPESKSSEREFNETKDVSHRRKK